jgi:hypothetical protein
MQVTIKRLYVKEPLLTVEWPAVPRPGDDIKLVKTDYESTESTGGSETSTISGIAQKVEWRQEFYRAGHREAGQDHITYADPVVETSVEVTVWIA